VAGVAVLATCLSGCGSSSSSAGPGASPTAQATQPLTFYAAQYLKIVEPGETAVASMRKITANYTVAQAQAIATAAAAAVKQVDAALLQASWPAAIAADIRAEVTADAPILRDLANLAKGSGHLVADSRAANSAANITRAALGLPLV
jgi:hypothetical protein